MRWSERKNVFFLKIQSGNFYQLWFLIYRRLKINFLMKPIGVLIAILVIPLVYALKPFIKINFYSIPTGRLGHLLLQPEIYLRQKKISINTKKSFDIFFTSRSMQGGVVANKQVLKMLKRNILVLDSYFSSFMFYSAEWLILYTDLIAELPHLETVEAE